MSGEMDYERGSGGDANVVAAASGCSGTAEAGHEAVSDGGKDAASPSSRPVAKGAGALGKKGNADAAPFWAAFRPWKPAGGWDAAEGHGSASSSSGPVVEAKGGPGEAGKGESAGLAGAEGAKDVAAKTAPTASGSRPGRYALKQGMKVVDKCRARAPRPPAKKAQEDAGLDGEIAMSSGQSEGEGDGNEASDNGGGGRYGGSRWRAGKKTRRLKVGEAGGDDAQDKDDHVDMQLSKEVLNALDLPAAEVPPELADAVAKARTRSEVGGSSGLTWRRFHMADGSRARVVILDTGGGKRERAVPSVWRPCTPWKARSWSCRWSPTASCRSGPNARSAIRSLTA